MITAINIHLELSSDCYQTSAGVCQTGCIVSNQEVVGPLSTLEYSTFVPQCVQCGPPRAIAHLVDSCFEGGTGATLPPPFGAVQNGIAENIYFLVFVLGLMGTDRNWGFVAGGLLFLLIAVAGWQIKERGEH